MRSILNELKQPLHRTKIIYLAIVIILFMIINLLSGNFYPRWVPDTPTYQNLDSLTQALGGARTPFYGLFLAGVYAFEGSYTLVPILQLSLYCVVVYLLYKASIFYGLSRLAGVALCLPLLISNVVIRYTNYLHPEIVAVSFLLLSFGGILMIASHRASNKWLIVSPISLSFAYLLKPAFLIFIIFSPLLLLVLHHLKNRITAKKLAVNLFTFFVISITPFLAYSTLRYEKLGDFHIVSYSGFNGLGLSGQIMSPETQNKVSSHYGDVIVNALYKRSQLEEQRVMLPLPKSSTAGKPVYWSAVLGYFDVFAVNYDPMMNVLANELNLESDNKSLVVLNKRANDFNWEIMKAEPLNYLFYILGATKRFAGLLMATNLAFMVSLIVCVLVLVTKVFSRHPPSVLSQRVSSESVFDLCVLFFINILYVIGNFIPAVVLSFPALRYVDTAGIFMSAIPTYLFIKIWLRFKTGTVYR